MIQHPRSRTLANLNQSLLHQHLYCIPYRSTADLIDFLQFTLLRQKSPDRICSLIDLVFQSAVNLHISRCIFHLLPLP